MPDIMNITFSVRLYCFALNNVGICSGSQLSYLGTSLNLFSFKFFWGESNLDSRANLAPLLECAYYGVSNVIDIHQPAWWKLNYSWSYITFDNCLVYSSW